MNPEKETSPSSSPEMQLTNDGGKVADVEAQDLQTNDSIGVDISSSTAEELQHGDCSDSNPTANEISNQLVVDHNQEVTANEDTNVDTTSTGEDTTKEGKDVVLIQKVTDDDEVQSTVDEEDCGEEKSKPEEPIDNVYVQPTVHVKADKVLSSDECSDQVLPTMEGGKQEHSHELLKEGSSEESNIVKHNEDEERVTPIIENLSSNESCHEEIKHESLSFESHNSDYTQFEAKEVSVNEQDMREQVAIHKTLTPPVQEFSSPRKPAKIEEEEKKQDVGRSVEEENDLNLSSIGQTISTPSRQPPQQTSHPLYVPPNYSSFNGGNSLDMSNLIFQSQQQFQPPLSHHLHHTPIPPQPTSMHEHQHMGFYQHQSAFSQPQMSTGNLLNSTPTKFPHQRQQLQHYHTAPPPPPPPAHMPSNRRAIKLRLVEERKLSTTTKHKFFRLPTLKKSNHPSTPGKGLDRSHHNDETHSNEDGNDGARTGLLIVERGDVSVSWYEGTSTSELQEHVRKSVKRKLDLSGKKTIHDVRIIDTSVDPHEEIVLSPFIPDGSTFLIKFSIESKLPYHQSSQPRAPDSPSAAPSPSRDLDMLHQQINEVLSSGNKHKDIRRSASEGDKIFNQQGGTLSSTSSANSATGKELLHLPTNDRKVKKPSDQHKQIPQLPNDTVPEPPSKADAASNDAVSDSLQKLNETLMRIDAWESGDGYRPVEKKQVVFMIANYLMLFLSFIAISAEIHERAPRWIEWVNENVSSVQNCAADHDALFECISNGDFTGLVASIILWATNSVATKQIFLFGFQSTQKLWTVVYESFVTAFCWGTSYILIRRGLNPDTRDQFLHKYWKDALYGSLAGFNAAFMKAVLKNLLPQADQVLDVLEHRQLRIVNFLGKVFFHDKD